MGSVEIIFAVWDCTYLGLFVGLVGEYIQQRQFKAHKTKQSTDQNLGSISI